MEVIISQSGVLDIEQNNPQIPTSFTTDDGTAIPIANNLEILGSTVLANVNPMAVETTGSGKTVTIEVQVSQALAAADITKVGLANFDSNDFAVDADGFVTLSSSQVYLEKIGTQTGINPVIPDGTGLIDIHGAVVLAGVNPIRTDGIGVSAMDIELQLSQALAAPDVTKVGISNFDSAAFAVDADGFVTLVGGGTAATNLDVDSFSFPGTDPVLPDGSGNIVLTGAQVAAGVVGTNVIRTDSLAASTVTIEIQRSTTSALSDVTLNGVAHFDSAEFTVDADGFVSLAGGGLAIDSIGTQTGTNPIVPDSNGLVTINGAVVAAGTNPVRSDGTGANTMAIEVQISQALAATDATKIGLSNFDSAAFDVDANGFVQLNGGGIAATSFDVQSATVPGTDPVLPAADGTVTVNGAAVANHSVVIETHSRAANAYNVEVQYSAAVAGTDATKSGVAHFDSAAFDVDANGFVQLNGGGVGVTSVNVDASTPPGTDPVVASATGEITITGAQVATGVVGANVIRTDSLAANTFTIEIQRTTAVAAADSTKNGVSHFDSASFTVDSDGFVSINGSGLAETITGDSGGALSPTAGNWNILGATGGVNWRTSGSGSTLTGRSDILNRTVPGAYPYTALDSDYVIEVDTSSARTINLPNAPTTGKSYVIKDVTGSAATNNITLTTVGGAVTIDGSTSRTLTSNYVSTSVYFNGTSYFII